MNPKLPKADPKSVLHIGRDDDDGGSGGEASEDGVGDERNNDAEAKEPEDEVKEAGQEADDEGGVKDPRTVLGVNIVGAVRVGRDRSRDGVGDQNGDGGVGAKREVGGSSEEHVYERGHQGAVKSVLDRHSGEHPVGHTLGNNHETDDQPGNDINSKALRAIVRRKPRQYWYTSFKLLF